MIFTFNFYFLSRWNNLLVKLFKIYITFRLLHLKYPELNEEAYGSSLSRENRYGQLTNDKDAISMQDMLAILGNRDDDQWPIFSDKQTSRVNTINLGKHIMLNKFYFS